MVDILTTHSLMQLTPSTSIYKFFFTGLESGSQGLKKLKIKEWVWIIVERHAAVTQKAKAIPAQPKNQLTYHRSPNFLASEPLMQSHMKQGYIKVRGILDNAPITPPKVETKGKATAANRLNITKNRRNPSLTPLGHGLIFLLV